jgi:cell division inhibitor SepF
VRPLQTPASAPIVAEEPAARQGVLRPLTVTRPVAQKVHIVAPEHFSEAQEIGDVVKQASPVIVNLQLSDRDLARRMIDFCSGLTYALGGSMEKVAEQVFLITPSNVEVTAEERIRLQERGLFQQ